MAVLNQQYKGIDTTIRAASLLNGQYRGLQYFVIGTGPDQRRLERIADELRLDGLVKFVGPVDEGTKGLYYAACDVFMLPNRVEYSRGGERSEGFGIVFLEAAAAGRPVIGGDSGGVPEAVERDETGLLVDGTSPQAVAEAIRALAWAPHLRARFGRAGRDRVIRRFTWARAAEQVMSLHARVAAGRWSRA